MKDGVPIASLDIPKYVARLNFIKFS